MYEKAMDDPRKLKKIDTFKDVDEEFLATIKLVSFTWQENDALLITFDDQVYAIGPNENGQHGVGDKESSTEPRRVDALCNKEIVSFSFGYLHALAISENGNVYSWGGNDYGQLGNNSSIRNFTPALVEGLQGKRMAMIASGFSHSLTLTQDAEVFAFGLNNCGQLGDGTQNYGCLVPQRVNYAPTAMFPRSFPVQVASGFHFSMMLLNTGEIFSWGRNDFGQLGLGHKQEFVSTPCHVKALEGQVIAKVACGYYNALALSDSGHLYSWGIDEVGHLGNGNFEESHFPCRIAEEEGPFCDIALFQWSNMLSAISCATKTCYIWGATKSGSVKRPMKTWCKSFAEAFWRHSKSSFYPGQIAFSENRANSLKAHYKMAFNNKEMSNVTFIIDGQELHAFKEILMVRCEHFRTMFKKCWHDTTGKPILINQVSYPVYKAFLYYLYAEEVELESLEEIIELLDLAHSYLELELTKECELLLLNEIDVANAPLLYTVALKYEAKTLEQSCFDFSVANLDKIAESGALSNLDDEAAKAFLEKMAAC